MSEEDKDVKIEQLTEMLDKTLTALENSIKKPEIKEPGWDIRIPPGKDPTTSPYKKVPLTRKQRLYRILYGLQHIMEPWHGLEDENGFLGYNETKTQYRIYDAINLEWREAWEGYQFIHKEDGHGISIYLHEELYGVEENSAPKAAQEIGSLIEKFF